MWSDTRIQKISRYFGKILSDANFSNSWSFDMNLKYSALVTNECNDRCWKRNIFYAASICDQCKNSSAHRRYFHPPSPSLSLFLPFSLLAHSISHEHKMRVCVSLWAHSKTFTMIFIVGMCRNYFLLYVIFNIHYSQFKGGVLWIQSALCSDCWMKKVLNLWMWEFVLRSFRCHSLRLNRNCRLSWY